MVSMYNSWITFTVCCMVLTKCEIIYLGASSPYMEFRNIEQQESKLVWIKGCKDGVVGLFESVNISSLVFELVIGGWGNTITAIRIHSPINSQVYARDKMLMLIPNEYTPFWIKWTRTTVYIRPGTIDNNGPVIQWTRNDTISIRYMAFRTGTQCPLKYALDLSCSRVDVTRHA
ncbi:hypothetical protein SNE40_005383 [Patella caerulea]|uniref:Farnesoic acid O-methyl transferase domain-containing protein n=1 Tax=Patella caerulea TaxID=87958 RepID=A0AAN8K3I2_PATCE